MCLMISINIGREHCRRSPQTIKASSKFRGARHDSSIASESLSTCRDESVCTDYRTVITRLLYALALYESKPSSARAPPMGECGGAFSPTPQTPPHHSCPCR